jgi:hypothetical protein
MENNQVEQVSFCRRLMAKCCWCFVPKRSQVHSRTYHNRLRAQSVNPGFEIPPEVVKRPLSLYDELSFNRLLVFKNLVALEDIRVRAR